MAQFIVEVNAQRSTGLFVTRTIAPIIFHDLDAPVTIWTASNFKDRRVNQVLLTLLAPPVNASAASSSPFSSIFFPSQQYNMSLLFMNEYQPKVSRVNSDLCRGSSFHDILFSFFDALSLDLAQLVH